MSKLEKLSIQGIRSFGPDEGKRIEFYTPLTLILGQNGCGKTTIIESLKYITTGEFPPGCGRGALFVHDPKVAKESSVRGQVKLMFHSNRGNKQEKIVSSRSVEVTQKAKKLECKTIEATITRTLEDGRKQSISHKCADIQSEMTSLLGVSKPILENVIFCHQEESNWPLEEGKKVKEKFDAIFNATKYIKCLDAIKKLRTEERRRLTNMEETVDALKASKDHSTRLQSELQQVEKNQNEIREEKQTMQGSLVSIRDRLREVLEIENSRSTIKGDLGGKELELQSNLSFQRELREGQNETFVASDDELQRMIEDFDQISFEKERSLQRVEREMKKTEADITAVKSKQSAELQKIGRLEAANNTHLENVNNMNKRIAKLVQTYDIEDFVEERTFEYHDAEELLKKLQSLLQLEGTKITDKRMQFRQNEAAIQAEVDRCRKDESALEFEIENCVKKLDELQRNSRAARQTMRQNENELSTENLGELRTSIADLDAKIKNEIQRVDVNELEKDIGGKKRNLRLIEQDVHEVKQKINKLNQQTEARAHFDLLIKERQELENINKHLKRKHAEDFEVIFGGSTGENLRNELEVHMRRTQESKDAVKAKKDAAEVKKAKIEVKNSNAKSAIAKKEKDIADFERRVEDLCGGLDLQAALSRTLDQKDTLERTAADKTSSTNFVSGYIRKLQDNNYCPLCLREFDRRDEADSLIESLQTKLQQVPEKIKKANENLEVHKKRHEKLLQLQSHEEQTLKAKEEVEQLKNEVKMNHDDLQRLDALLEEESLSFDVFSSDELTAKRIHSDVIEIDKNYKKINSTKNKLDDINITLGNYGSEATMDDLMQEQTNYEDKIRTTRESIDTLQTSIMQHKDALQKLQSKRVAAATRELELQTKSKEVEKLKDELLRYERERVASEALQEESKTKVAPIKFTIKDKLASKVKLEKESQQWMEEANKYVDALKEASRRLNDTYRCVKSYILEGGLEKLLESREQLSRINADASSLDVRRREFISKINEIKEEIALKKDKKRNLDDEKKIRAKVREQKQLEEDIARLKAKIKEFDYETLVKEKDQLLLEENKLMTKRATSQGRLEELDRRRKELSSILNKSEIKNAQKNYRTKLFEKKCIEVATEDLNAYYKALYTAVMRFHAEKMATINRIIRELWRTTYKGNDIDYVEIKTDEAESVGANKRQTYNYWVVMFKGDVEMDMRGRCSAGQKVLASLLIRMALAESFSANCGILALDEPTTNLDRLNIEALAAALLNIVNKRSHQSNFQLIVITHDEEFLNKLTKANYTEHYHKVLRDHRGLSMILRKHSD